MISKAKLSSMVSMALMIAILIVAAIFSAMTAMRVAIRGSEVVVQDLTGKTEAEAKLMLEKSGLVMRVSQSRFIPGVPEGHIAEQNPPKGTSLKTGRSVKVLVSRGERKYPVPSLIGNSVRTAQLMLAERKLTLGITDHAYTNEGTPDTVAYQSPPPDTVEGADPTVNILVSLGPLVQYYTMPDLVSQSFDSVSARARIEGFKIGKPTFRKYPGIAPGIVIQQKPQAGYRLSKNDSILLEVSQ